MVDVTDATFETEILERSDHVPVVVDLAGDEGLADAAGENEGELAAGERPASCGCDLAGIHPHLGNRTGKPVPAQTATRAGFFLETILPG